MPTTKKVTNEATGPQRASDFNGALQAVPGQSAMMHVLQYSYMAQTTLRKCDFEALIEASQEAGKILHECGSPIDCTGSQTWPEDAERINAQIKEKYSEFPAVTGGFKRHVEHARAAIAASK
ncbi:Hypothetical protein NCS54_00346900 [Fusarium falciforme]|uniref:Hypothetical protein n=1 Tax=Fusarium falciforme TaxID=195108 RepID=UPI002300753B|nr:Hypothetical protein NCS54_00346900 [Fusarium falciforme]WAO86204.1 Hypothetical protein NCS54_00346900 [Fusarium falciforme]